MHFVDVLNIGKDIIKANKKHADKNRNLLNKHGVIAFDFMGAIGSGKTLLIEYLIEKLKDKYKIACIAGDVIAKYDAGRMEKHGVKVIPLNTGKECHLDAHLVGHVFPDLDLENLDIIFIENVGNLICPTDFDLGTHKRIVVVSVTEGDDTVEKHPEIFKTADLTIINKIDIAEAVGADPVKMKKDAESINKDMKVLLTSVKTKEGLDEVIEFIEETAKSAKQ
ncbi:MAG: hydrogenase nickel incorporation protein HypB [Methanothermococcus sp.]|jgi:hydrogenase nickel incorporation protein HypB|uniref:hydrogenase nickel incorporation protein HypB n=1 Tax=Methanothermococcus TaxID=155862 RepID=UPI000379CB34|nr:MULTISPECIES: hydrogenase nickel incorporation protein HypB [Methanothermococcus]MDK2791091.1 hydrogenase nickel incorporation protein HypB [Methanothermococcus sp.]MDK2988250.1 hydrogenase nickel incorporation protein HypB [Methanothermococcus sp.]